MEELILDRYRPLAQAGAGAFGTVQVAWDTTIQRKVAIKCIRLSDVDAMAMQIDGALSQGAVRADNGRFGAREMTLDLSGAPADAFADAALAQMASGLGDGGATGDAYAAGGSFGAYGADFMDADADAAAMGRWGAGADAGTGAFAEDYASESGYEYEAVYEEEEPETPRKGVFSRLISLFGKRGSTAQMPALTAGEGDGAGADAGAGADGAGAGAAGSALAAGKDHWLANIAGLDEARTAAMLSDPHIVAVYDFQVVGTMAYLIMEYVEGMTLTRFLRDHDDQLTLDIIAAVFGDVAHALSAAHNAGVLHLDVKPDNILIDKRGLVKVTDFGLATLADANGNGVAGGGTIGYMPPEQMRQLKLDARCDEWALASIAYEMLAGKNPFLAPTLEGSLALTRDADLVLPSLCWGGIDRRVDDAVFTALELDPDDRFATVAEFADELNPCLGDAAQGCKALAAIVSEAAEGELLDTVGMGGIGLGAEGANAGALNQPGAGGADHGAGDAIAAAVDLMDDHNRSAKAAKKQRTTASRAGGHFFGIWGRVLGCILASLVMLLACVNLPLFSTFQEPVITELFSRIWPAALDVPAMQNSLLWALVAANGILSLIKPSWGALVALVALGIMVAVNGNILVGIVFALVAVGWWWLTGRHGAAQSNCGLAYVVLGGFGFAPLAVLATGIGMRVLDAAMTVVFGIFACMVFAGFGTADIMSWDVLTYWNFSAVDYSAGMTATLGSVANWAIAATWLAAAVIGGICTMARVRWLNIVGAVASVVCLIMGICFAASLTSDPVSWLPATPVLVKTIICCVIGLAAAWFFIPEPYSKSKNKAKGKDGAAADNPYAELPQYVAPQAGRLYVDPTPRTRRLGK